MSPTISTFALNNGVQIPAVGLGCWMGKPAGDDQSETEQMIESGIKAGYTHFDTASGYGNERAVGNALKASGLPRERFFVTTKLNGPDHPRVAEAFQESLKELGGDYIDLYLMHWPQSNNWTTGETVPFDESPTFQETWAEMEKLLDTGKVKAIGVSNFSIKNLELLFQTAKVVPAVNQVELHPYLPQEKLLAYCKEKGIHLTAYCPLGQGNSPILREELIISLAEKYKKPVGAVLLSWNVQRGVSVVPKSSNPDRMKQNLDIFPLSTSDASAISSLVKTSALTKGKELSLCQYGPGAAKRGYICGWSMEEMGWDYDLAAWDGEGWKA